MALSVYARNTATLHSYFLQDPLRKPRFWRIISLLGRCCILSSVLRLRVEATLLPQPMYDFTVRCFDTRADSYMLRAFNLCYICPLREMLKVQPRFSPAKSPSVIFHQFPYFGSSSLLCQTFEAVGQIRGSPCVHNKL